MKLAHQYQLMVQSLLTAVKCCESSFVPEFFWKKIQFLPAMAYHMVPSSWIPPLCETGTAVVHMTDSLRVNMATGLTAEVGTGDRCRSKGTAAEPVELKTKPTESVFEGKGITTLVGIGRDVTYYLMI